MTRVLVCGGRNFRSPAQIARVLDQLHAERKFTALIQGGATGADALAKDWAKTKPEIQRFESRAQWDDLSHSDAEICIRGDGTKYDKSAGRRRNAHMLTWKPDLVIAFAGGPGTANMIAQARAAGVEVIEVGK